MAVFYLKYRPQKFSDIVGQEHAVKTLLSQLESGKIGHGYLFAGPRGTGKTSTARIFAKAVNCEVYRLQSTDYSKKKVSSRKAVDRRLVFGEPCNKCKSCMAVVSSSHLDLIEIDAASNRLIEDVRDLREKIKLSPVSSRFKVYIIDEAHMLTREAFNALLKTLEEPPKHAIFILCTTEPSKLPTTIISRVQRFNFQRAKDTELYLALEKIIKEEGIKIDEEAIFTIAKAADGSFRDAVSFLDQLSAASKKITKDDIKNMVLVSDWNLLFGFIESVVENKLKDAVLTVEKLWQEKADVSAFVKEVILLLEDVFFIKLSIEKTDSDLDDAQLEKLRELAQKTTNLDIQNLIKLFLVAEGESKQYPLPHIPVILAICKYCLSDADQKGQVEIAKDTPAPLVQSNIARKGVEANSKKATPSKSSISFAHVQKNWNDFLQKVRPHNTHLTAILRSVRPFDFDGQNLTCEVFYRFHKEKLEEIKTIRLLEEIMEEVMGAKIKLRFVLAKKTAVVPKPVKSSDVVDIDSQELEKIAQEIFLK